MMGTAEAAPTSDSRSWRLRWSALGLSGYENFSSYV